MASWVHDCQYKTQPKHIVTAYLSEHLTAGTM